MIVIVSCGARKRAEPSEAIKLYTGPYFAAMRAWAQSVVPLSHIFILSARHGLIPSGRVIGPYEQRMNQADAVTADRVRRQATDLGLLDDEVVVLGGKPYVQLVRSVWPQAVAPFASGGIGTQMGAMKRARGTVPS